MFRRRIAVGCQGGRKAVLALQVLQLLDDVPFGLPRFTVLSVKAQPHHGMADRPVPMPANVQAPEQLLVPFEQRLQRIRQEALAEPARAREKAVIVLLDQFPDDRSLVDVVVARLPESVEGLDAGRRAARH